MATTICANGSSARKEINGTIGPRTTTIAGLKCPPSGPKSRKIVGRTMSLDPGHLFNFQLKRANTKRSWDASILTPTHSRLNRLALSSLTSRQGIPTDNCFRLASPQKKREAKRIDQHLADQLDWVLCDPCWNVQGNRMRFSFHAAFGV